MDRWPGGRTAGLVDGPLAWWRPGADDPAMFYVVAGCLGLCDAIWCTQTNSQSAPLAATFPGPDVAGARPGAELNNSWIYSN